MAKSPSEQIRELATDIRLAQERDEQRRRELEKVVSKVEAMQAEIAPLQQENAVLRQQLQDHIRQTELRDSRRWALTVALIGVLVGALMSLASGVILTLARK